jgi:hypothetical protein
MTAVEGTVAPVTGVAAEHYGFMDQDGTQPRSLRPQFEEVS